MSIRRPLTLLPALLAAAALAAAPRTAEAQFGRRLKDAIEHTAEDKAIQKTTETENKAIDSAPSRAPVTASAGATAAAVRQYLIGSYQLDGARLTANGLGASKPAAGNDTAEGRQQNRRVELVKM